MIPSLGQFRLSVFLADQNCTTRTVWVSLVLVSVTMPLPHLGDKGFKRLVRLLFGSLRKFFAEIFLRLFANQQSWARLGSPLDTFRSYAQQLELNMEQFEADYRSDEVRDKVAADQASGYAAGIDSTPTFYINGAPLANPRGLEGFITAIDAALTTPAAE